MNKLLCIVGPTATGKTARAIAESLTQPSIIVSADSRQVYRGMDIVTGKDHPKDVVIYGVDILRPDESCSVAVWYDTVMQPIRQAWTEGKQVIVVGGTGLYVKAITAGIDTMQVPLNQPLRNELESLSIPELQEKLISLDSPKFAAMNHSDALNPRRLIRAIEVSRFLHVGRNDIVSRLETACAGRRSREISKDSKMIGLKYSDESIQRNKIMERVVSRLSHGAIEETKKLLVKYNQGLQSMTAIGYKSIISFLEGNLTEAEMIEKWVSGEIAYAKRQMTWFRKQPVIWYDIDNYGN